MAAYILHDTMLNKWYFPPLCVSLGRGIMQGGCQGVKVRFLVYNLPESSSITNNCGPIGSHHYLLSWLSGQDKHSSSSHKSNKGLQRWWHGGLPEAGDKLVPLQRHWLQQKTSGSAYPGSPSGLEAGSHPEKGLCCCSKSLIYSHLPFTTIL